MHNKRRVLFVTESHKLASGFGTYAKQVLPRLHATNKYELAEFASYGRYDQSKEVPWAFFGNVPDSPDQDDTYNQSPVNHFGYWRFDKTVLSFKPDIVLTYRDPWMDDWIADSPMRPYFHWVWMPTVDSAPQKREWLETFASCDALFAYSEFGARTLLEESKNKLNVIGCASPAIDPEIYKPVPNKRAHKESFGLSGDINIVGTVMRNQKRKLFIELMRAFRTFLDKAPKDISEKTFLYLHTSYPEKIGWNIAEGILDNNLQSNVLVTYICRHCRNFFVSPFQDALTTCKKCHVRGAVMPNVSCGLEIPDLIKVYNLFDLYVQYAICEGFGMPQVEAAACGVPVAATDYSAMEDVVRFTKGYPIDVKTMFREMETNADRAYPDNDHLAQILLDHFSMSESETNKRCIETRNGTIKRYNWDQTAAQWENYIDSYEPTGQQGRWDSSPNLFEIPSGPPDIQFHEDFVRWCYINVLREPDKSFSYQAEKFAQSLEVGAMIDGGNLESFDREKFWNMMTNRANNKLVAEKIRCGMLEMHPERFIQEAYKS